MNKTKALSLVILGVVSLVFLSTAADAAKRSKKSQGPHRVSSRSALLIDERGRHKYYAKKIDAKVLPASTVKVMTALIVLERKRLDDIITISARAERVLPTKVGLKKGEKFRVRDLLYALLLNSANDAAVALAEGVAGTEAKFVDLMNKRARQFRARHTLFANSHGLSSQDPQYSTAYDMFLIFREALKKRFLSDALKVKTMNIHSLDGRRIELKSNNRSLFWGWKKDVYGKTGYTMEADACFVGHVIEGKKHLFITLFAGSSRWEDIQHIIRKYGGIDL